MVPVLHLPFPWEEEMPVIPTVYYYLPVIAVVMQPPLPCLCYLFSVETSVIGMFLVVACYLVWTPFPLTHGRWRRGEEPAPTVPSVFNGGGGRRGLFPCLLPALLCLVFCWRPAIPPTCVRPSCLHVSIHPECLPHCPTLQTTYLPVYTCLEAGPLTYSAVTLPYPPQPADVCTLHYLIPIVCVPLCLPTAPCCPCSI